MRRVLGKGGRGEVEVGDRYVEFRSSGCARREKVGKRWRPESSSKIHGRCRQMPITAFNSFTDGFDPNRRSCENFIPNINLEDDRLWVPYATGVWVHPCSFIVTS